MSGKVRQNQVSSDGDAPASRLLAQARSFVRLCFQWSLSNHRSPILRSLTLYPPSTSRNGQWLVVAKVWDDGEKLVGFHRASDPLTALLGTLTKLANSTLALKADTYHEAHHG